MPKKFNMDSETLIYAILHHCNWSDKDEIATTHTEPENIWDIPCNLPDTDLYSDIHAIFTKHDGCMFVFAYKAKSINLNYMNGDFLTKNWMLRYSPESIDMRYRPGEDWNVCGFIYDLYDRITWESLKGVDEDA